MDKNKCNRRVMVYLAPFKYRSGKKVFSLPAKCEEDRLSDLVILRQKVFKIIMENPCYHKDLGVTPSTKLEQFKIFQRFSGFSEEIEEDLGPSDEVEDLTENLFVRVDHSISEESQMPQNSIQLTGHASQSEMGNSSDAFSIQEIENQSPTFALLDSNSGVSASQKKVASGTGDCIIQENVSQAIPSDAANANPSGTQMSAASKLQDESIDIDEDGEINLTVIEDEENLNIGLGTIFVIEQKDLPVEEPLLDITNRDVPPTRPLSLPEEGDEDSDLNPSLITALRDKKISLKFDAFIRVCAKHLEKTQPTRSRAMYASYAQMIVQQYGEDNPCLKDLDGGSKMLKSKIVRSIGNRKGNLKHKEPRKAKRNAKKRPLNHQDDQNVDQSEADNNAQHIEDDEDAAEKTQVAEFKARRLLVNALDNFSTAELFQVCPEYKDFNTMYGDFLRMIESSNEISETVFKKHFVWLLDEFRSFLVLNGNSAGAGSLEYPVGEDGNLALILAINQMASNVRGVKGVPPLFVHKQLGKAVDPPPNGVNPHAILFSDGPKLSSMLILGGGILHFKNIKVDSVCDAVFNLVAVHYAIRLEYPATYGILDIVDRYCFRKADVEAPLVRKSKRSAKNAKKDFQCITNFIGKFNKYLIDDFKKQSGIAPGDR